MNESQKREDIEVLFRDLRFGKQHLGLGDIRLTIAEQDELVDAILAVMARYCSLEYYLGIESTHPKMDCNSGGRR